MAVSDEPRGALFSVEQRTGYSSCEQRVHGGALREIFQDSAFGTRSRGVANLCRFAPEILKLWLGSGFANHGVGVLRILAVGVLINCFVQVPSNFLYGLGRPDVVAKLLLAELPFYAPFCYLMVRGAGIDGAAFAWSIRVTVEVLLMIFLAHRFLYMPLVPVRERGAFRAFTLATGFVAFLMVTTAGSSLNIWARGGIAVIMLAAYGWAVWRWALDDADRTAAA